MFLINITHEYTNFHRFSGGLGATLLLWPTITEQLHLSHNVHNSPDAKCLTAKTGLLGGGAFVSLDSSLFWLVALMLADNAREDYFEELEESRKGLDGQEYDGPDHLKSSA